MTILFLRQFIFLISTKFYKNARYSNVDFEYLVNIENVYWPRNRVNKFFYLGNSLQCIKSPLEGHLFRIPMPGSDQGVAMEGD